MNRQRGSLLLRAERGERGSGLMVETRGAARIALVQ